MPNEQDLEFMQLALVEAQKARALGEVPVGAVLVSDNQVIATGHNQPISNNDPSAHAEVAALRAAGQNLSNYRLPNTTLYVTLEPCMMCCGAIMHARISRVVYGAADAKTGCVHSVLNLFDNPQLNHHTMVEGGVLAEECAQVLKDFFKERRA
ncbi:tRNA(adenine34) deaminase [Polynucleobacter victoriensis]|uniref:tRNA-specific adenosine deaminase n=2 Tax=Polynucleobacter victoriensis TaxID=2049319 RepID=A0A212T003_9BURK|nr:tRNA(adenine34) deaminase [Polynucleobacter victoriensis]